MQTTCTGNTVAMGQRWMEAKSRFLDAVHPTQRPLVDSLLQNPRHGGRGLRLLLRNLLIQDQTLPALIPAAVIEVYLSDPEAVPLFDCHDCGLPVPVRFNIQDGFEETPEREYFPSCPQCGGRTGRYAYWSNTAASKTENSGPTAPRHTTHVVSVSLSAASVG